MIALITAVCLLGDSALYVILPSRLEAFSVSPTGAGLILGVNRYIRIASNTAAGWVFARLGFYGPIYFAVLLAAATTLSYGLFSGFWPLFIAHGLWGICWSFLRLGGYLAVVESAGGDAIGRFMGVLQSVSRGGSLFAVIAGGILADAIGGPDTFVIFGLLTVIAAGLVPFARVRKDLGRTPAVPGPAPTQAAAAPGGSRASAWRMRTLYAEALITWLLIPGLFVSTAGYLVRTVTSDGADVLGVVIGVGALSGILVGVLFVGDLGLAAPLGHVSDRVGRSKVILVAAVAAAAAMTTVAWYPTLPVALAMFSVIFIASTALMVSLNASAAELAPPERRAMSLSRYATWADVGSGTGPIVGLWTVTNMGFGWAYGSGAAIMAAAALLHWAVFVRKES